MFDYAHQLLTLHLVGACVCVCADLVTRAENRTIGVMMLSVHCIVFHLSYFVVYAECVSVCEAHTLLLSVCLHFMSLKMKFIYSIITHFSKLFPHCQHNLLPSALMAAQLWMVDGYLIGENTSHWTQEGGETEGEAGRRNQSRRSRLLSTLCRSADKY